MIQGPTFSSPASPAAHVDSDFLRRGSSASVSGPDRLGTTLRHDGADSPAESDAFLPSRPKCTRDELERLGEEIAELAAHLHAAIYRLLVRLRDFDEQNGWNVGFLNCAHWLSWRTGIAPGAAREKVRVARSLADLPQLARAMELGEVSYSKVRALTRIATPDNEGELLEVARHATAAQVETIVRAWRRVDRRAEAEEERERHESRYLSLRIGDDGSYIVRGRLDPEVGALLERALEVAGKALYDEHVLMARAKQAAECSPIPPRALSGVVDPDVEHPETAGEAAADADRNLATTADEAATDHGLELPTAPQRRADALVLLVELALSSEALATETGPATRLNIPHDDSSGTPATRSEELSSRSRTHHSPAGEPAAARRPAYRSLGRAARVQVVLHVDAEALRADCDSGQSILAGGLRVPAETSRRLTCDASRVVMVHDENGSVLDVGRSTRTVPPAIRRALDHRDAGCRFPGCWNRFTDAHHLKHWADGGETRLDNLLLLCRRHHRAVHEEGFRVTRTGSGTFTFTKPDGRPLRDVPPSPALSVQTVTATGENAVQKGIAVGDKLPALYPGSGAPTFLPPGYGERFDLHWLMRMLYKPATSPGAAY